MTWQPISSAPRDGSMFLGWLDVGGYELAYRHRGEWRYGPKGYVLHLTHWQPLPPPPTPTSDTAAFLARMKAAAETGERVTADDVARLRKLADWADAPPPAGWNGTLDRGEAMRAVEAAERRMRDE